MNKQYSFFFALSFAFATIFATPLFADNMSDSDMNSGMSDAQYDETKSFSELDRNSDNVITENEAEESSALQNDFYEVATEGEITREEYVAWVEAKPEGFEANDYDWFQMIES